MVGGRAGEDVVCVSSSDLLDQDRLQLVIGRSYLRGNSTPICFSASAFASLIMGMRRSADQTYLSSVERLQRCQSASGENEEDERRGEDILPHAFGCPDNGFLLSRSSSDLETMCSPKVRRRR